VRFLFVFAITCPLGVLLNMAFTKWMPADPHLRVLAFPSSKLASSRQAVGTVMIRNDGGRDATNVVCTISNCAPEQVGVTPPPPQSTTETRTDGLTVTIPVLKPREFAHVSVILAEGSSYSGGDVAVRGDGLVGHPWQQEPDRFPYVSVPLFICACLLLWWAWARAARMHQSPGGGTAVAR